MRAQPNQMPRGAGHLSVSSLMPASAGARDDYEGVDGVVPCAFFSSADQRASAATRTPAMMKVVWPPPMYARTITASPSRKLTHCFHMY